MIHTDYKLRPSAKEVLDSPTIRNQVCFNKSEIHRFHLWLIKICHMASPFASNPHRPDHVWNFQRRKISLKKLNVSVIWNSYFHPLMEMIRLRVMVVVHQLKNRNDHRIMLVVMMNYQMVSLFFVLRILKSMNLFFIDEFRIHSIHDHSRM